jgi:hypothetical protein
MSNTRNRIRIAVDLAYPYKAPVNTRTTKSAEFPKSKTTRVDIAVFDNSIFQTSISQFTSVTFELIAAADRTGARLVSKTVSAASFSNGISLSGWNNGTEQHATFEISASEASVFTIASNEQALWLVITAVSADGNITLVAGAAKAIEDGGVYSGASAPVAGDPNYLTTAQAYAAIAAAVENKRLLSKDGLYEVILDVIDGEVVFHANEI